MIKMADKDTEISDKVKPKGGAGATQETGPNYSAVSPTYLHASDRLVYDAPGVVDRTLLEPIRVTLSTVGGYISSAASAMQNKSAKHKEAA